MKLIVGLGNPGKEYNLTRHNAGFLVVDELIKKMDGVSSATCQFVKPQTFMNRSGLAVRKICQKYRVDPQDLLVVHDDLDLILPSFKLAFGKGPKAHNGILSIEEALGTKDFWRLRVGVEGRIKDQEPASSAGGSRIKGEEYVLSKFTGDEVKKLEEIEPRIRLSVEKWIES